MRRRAGQRGGATVEYVGVMVVAVALVGGMLSTGAVDRVADACVAAVCRLLGGDCAAAGGPAPGDGAAPGDGPQGPPLGPAGLLGSAFPDPGPVTPDIGPGQPPRPPIPDPVCTSDPDVAWTEGLHAHNDYENEHALQDALDHGATSVEVDVWIEDGEVVIKHDKDDQDRGTLHDTYLAPLEELARRNGGQIYPGRDKPFQILIEIKDGETPGAYQRVVEELGDLPPGVQVVFDPANRDPEEIGNQPPGVFFNQTPAHDEDGCHIPPELDPGSSSYDRGYAQNFTMLNGGYDSCADLDDNGEVDDEEQQKLNRFVDEAHAAGYEVRIVEGPDGSERAGDPGDFQTCWFWQDECSKDAQEDWWQAAMDAGVDYVDTQHLTAGHDFLRSCGGG